MERMNPKKVVNLAAGDIIRASSNRCSGEIDLETNEKAKALNEAVDLILANEFKAMEAGKLIAAESIVKVIGLVLKHHVETDKKVVILDGFPRSLEQKKYFDQMIEEYRNNGLIRGHFNFAITVTEEEARKRINGRAVEAGDKARKDDIDSDAVNQRITAFVEETSPEMRRGENLHVISGMQGKDEVFGDTWERFIRLFENPSYTRTKKTRVWEAVKRSVIPGYAEERKIKV